MPRDRAISVIIPVYNEELNVEEVHARLAEVLQGGDVEFIFIDDGSTDGTVSRLQAIAAQDPRVRLIRLRRNYGQTAALSAGIEEGYRAQSRELLGGDLSVDSRRPLPPELAIPDAERADALESATMVAPAAGGDSTIALLFAVQGRYPLYGGIETDPPGGLPHHLTRDSVVAEEDLLRALGLKRMFLHAASIAFRWPDGPAFRAEAPLPPELDAVLARLAGTAS